LDLDQRSYGKYLILPEEWAFQEVAVSRMGEDTEMTRYIAGLHRPLLNMLPPFRIGRDGDA
jgi:hypothetical protein